MIILDDCWEILLIKKIIIMNGFCDMDHKKKAGTTQNKKQQQ